MVHFFGSPCIPGLCIKICGVLPLVGSKLFMKTTSWSNIWWSFVSRLASRWNSWMMMMMMMIWTQTYNISMVFLVASSFANKPNGIFKQCYFDILLILCWHQWVGLNQVELKYVALALHYINFLFTKNW